jgi:hypothetical protein
MPTRALPPPPSPWRVKALIALDPAGSSDSGLAVRLTGTLPSRPKRGKLTAPEFEYQGSVWNDCFFDDLGVFLARRVGRTGQVRLICEDSVFRSLTIARSIGTAIGAVRSFLVGCGWCPCDEKPLMIRPDEFRKHHFPLDTPKFRDEQKAAAIDRVQHLYGHGGNLSDDLAEAILMLDYVTTEMTGEWQ